MRESTLSRRIQGPYIESYLEEPSYAIRYTPLRKKWTPSRFQRKIVNGACGITLCALFLGLFIHAHTESAPKLVIAWNNTTQQKSKTAPKIKAPLLVAKDASGRLVRISQLDPAQYNSQSDYDIWWPSACSAASMTEVIDSYGYHYRIADIVAYESSINAITPEQGLMYATGIDDTVKKYGFKTRWMVNPSIQDVVDTANNGTPVIIGFPPYKWTGGHLLVIRGGKTINGVQYVHLADSSRYNIEWMTYDKFASYWGGTGAIVTPA